MGEGGAWSVLYTAQLTQKQKRWHDGVLRQQGRSLMLYSEAKRCIDQLHASSVTVGMELKSEKHIIQVEAQAGQEPPDPQPARPARTPGPQKAIKKPRGRRTLGLRSGKSRSSSSPAPLPEPAPRPSFSYGHSMASTASAPGPTAGPTTGPVSVTSATAGGRSVSFACEGGRDGQGGGEDLGGGRDQRLVTFMPLGGRPVPRLFVPPGGRSVQHILGLLEEC